MTMQTHLFMLGVLDLIKEHSDASDRITEEDVTEYIADNGLDVTDVFPNASDRFDTEFDELETKLSELTERNQTLEDQLDEAKDEIEHLKLKVRKLKRVAAATAIKV